MLHRPQTELSGGEVELGDLAGGAADRLPDGALMAALQAALGAPPEGPAAAAAQARLQVRAALLAAGNCCCWRVIPPC